MTEQPDAVMTENAPISPVGTRPCRCGAGPHPTHEGRCANGHTWGGHPGPRLLVGERSRVLWSAADTERHAIISAVLAAKGETPDGATPMLRAAAAGFAQAILIRDSAFTYIGQEGGPLSSHGRPRRAFAVWQAASDRAERMIRLLGLERQAHTLTPDGPRAYVAAMASQRSEPEVTPHG